MKIDAFIKRLNKISDKYGKDIEIGDFGNEIEFIKDKHTICTLFINDDTIFCELENKSIGGKNL